jgi:hypothetical protein
MLMIPRQCRNFSFLDKSELLKLKMKAMRSGMWLKSLRGIDRVLVDLTSVACNVHSITLAKCILAVTQKLHILFESELSCTLRSICFPTTFKLSVLAQKWGNTNTQEWINDIGSLGILQSANFAVIL